MFYIQGLVIVRSPPVPGPTAAPTPPPTPLGVRIMAAQGLNPVRESLKSIHFGLDLL